MSRQEIVRAEGFSYAYPGADDLVLREITLSVGAGQCHCLTGPTGAGKSTLALAVKGLLPAGRRQGTLHLAPTGGQKPPFVGLVLQNPETQLLAHSVGNEVAFGLENRCVDPAKMPGLVEGALAKVGLAKPLGFPVARLSVGEKYRLLLAAQLVLEPRLLLLDEPTAQLDAPGLAQLLELMGRLKGEGFSFLVCDHLPQAFAGLADAWWALDGEGRFGPASPPSALPEEVPTPEAPAVDGKALLEVKDLSLAWQPEKPLWRRLSFTVAPGELVAIQGENGSGKSTLLRCLTGFLSPTGGTVRLFGAAPVPARLRGRVGFLVQNPQRQFFENTVFEEVAFTLRRLGRNEEDVAQRVGEILSRCGIGHLAPASPHTLSYGEQRLVGLAAVLAPEPRLVLLDDPLAGLDRRGSARIFDLLRETAHRGEAAIVWTAHNRLAPPPWGHRTLRLSGGTLVSSSFR